MIYVHGDFTRSKAVEAVSRPALKSSGEAQETLSLGESRGVGHNYMCA